MTLSAGTRLGPYEILSALGAGGMGEVYRATDTALGRQVAIKVLPDAFAQDAERLARFEREAKTLAALNHPHIAQIYGLERSTGTQALVMELVEGEDLSQRIARGAIPLDEALPIARQIAEALEAAHEQGIIHRDLKPANIKVTPDGAVKVLDFGLAKLADVGRVPRSGPAGSKEQDPAYVLDATASPTITSPALMTGVGVLLGTAAYMSPEQAKGREADKRSDIWAFGCVLYEMLTGSRPFEGEDVTDVPVAVLSKEPDWSALPARVPASIRALLRRCLERDRRKRVADIAVALFALDEHASLSGSAAAPAAPLPRTPLRRGAVQAAVVLVVAAVAGAAVWVATRPGDPVPPHVSRLLITSPGAAALSTNGTDRDLAITPDGSRVVYAGNRGTQLFVRSLDAVEPVIVFTGAPRGPFASPDGQWIGFVDGTTVLKKVAVTGGPAVTVATLDGVSRGATWGPDDTVIVATSTGATGLQRVGAAGGPTTVLTRPDRAQGEADHLWPELLPGGRAVLFTITAVTGGLDAAQVAVLDLQTGMRKILVRGGSHAHYVPSGHLVYAAAGTLRAVVFDLARLETRGTPVPVVPDVVTTTNGGVDAVVAGDGTLAYVSGGGGVGGGATHARVGGPPGPRDADPGAAAHIRLPAAVTRRHTRRRKRTRSGKRHLGLGSGPHDVHSRQFDSSLDAYPVWTPDGSRLIFSSERTGERSLYWQAADGTGAVERLTESPNIQNTTAVSPDGRRLIFTATVPKTGEDVMQLELDGTHRMTPLVQSPFAERNGIVSPDGRWLAYEANDSGRVEISVRPFPEVNSGHWQVSTAGGTRPLWARSGQELFYASPTGAIMRVGVERGPSWAATTPTTLVKEGYFTTPGGYTGRTYDIAPDGQRFLMIKEGGGTDQAVAPSQIIVVQHFDEELKRLVPTK